MAATLPSLLAAALAATAAGRLPADGKALYREHCAGCHGADGGGDGPLAKDLRFKPRAFKEGKFAFGNTVDAMVKTVRSGVPGREVPQMPAFSSVLSDEEVAAVVDFVRTLMPLEAAAATLGMEMVVGDEARVARGILAPLDAGQPPIARGLLVGIPGGTTFEYALQDDARGFEELHLVAVRRGAFVTRSDWEGRGGRPLTPLGEVVWREPQWSRFGSLGLGADHGQRMWNPGFRRLRSTSTRGGAATIEYAVESEPVGDDVEPGVREIRESRRRELYRVRETPRALAGSDASFRQTFEMLPARSPAADAIVRWERVVPARAEGADDAARRQAIASRSGWWATQRPDGAFECVRVDFAPRSELRATGSSDAKLDRLGFELPASSLPMKVDVTTVVLRDVSWETVEHALAEPAIGGER